MSAAQSDPAFQEEFPGFDSRDSEILILDGPGDTTVRPPSPQRLPFLVAERERLLRWQKLLDQPQDKPPDELDRKSTSQGEML